MGLKQSPREFSLRFPNDSGPSLSSNLMELRSSLTPMASDDKLVASIEGRSEIDFGRGVL